ncbi:vWA domain-containing protein [Chryseobacterium populi]|uniref:von Willebrand factor type A-like protein n=1 Tax=Chryseobacterium populi TaxID=1144316 RepID=J3CLQ2_9FLAO|nr:VWA domain-containing protein [Chryseobacterium populi]EJL74051.1 von Willebrand factor type A-like protein [Chryseobacterium populi]
MKQLSFLLLILLLSCSQADNKAGKKEIPQQNIALLVDNSITMLAKDFKPNRISILKNALQKIINHKKENQAFSIIVYAGNSYLLCALTKDKNQLLSAADKIDTGILKLRPGTNFSNPLLNGILSLSSGFSNKSMLLFTDGKENVSSYPLDIPLQELIRNNIKVNTVIVTPKDFKIEPTQIDYEGNFIFEKTKVEPFDYSQPKKISSITGGVLNTLHTKEELLKFDFNKLISESQNQKKVNRKTLSQPENEKLSAVYHEIELVNDSLAIRFNQPKPSH